MLKLPQVSLVSLDYYNFATGIHQPMIMTQAEANRFITDASLAAQIMNERIKIVVR